MKTAVNLTGKNGVASAVRGCLLLAAVGVGVSAERDAIPAPRADGPAVDLDRVVISDSAPDRFIHTAEYGSALGMTKAGDDF